MVRREQEPKGNIMAIEINTQIINSGYDRKSCWTHARPGAIFGASPGVVVTMQKLDISNDDLFGEINDMRTDDMGRTWSKIKSNPSLGRIQVGDGVEEAVCDFTPMWHEQSGVLLGTGATTRYKQNRPFPHPKPGSTAYSVYNQADRTWSSWKRLELPDEPKFFSSCAGCTQRFDLPNGEILLPVYLRLMETAHGIHNFQCVSTIMRCSFDGETLRYIENGTELTIPTGRGFCEPSLAFAAGRYFLTLRNNDAGYVTASRDGLRYAEPVQWRYDDGAELGNYNTQQHWITHGDDLYLVYTRRGANNDHVMRHRAPLFMAQVDTEQLRVIRDTEQVIIPERGARLGNFGVTRISERESWVVAAEWMQTTLPDPFDCTVCEKYGSDNSIWLARIKS